MTLSPEAQAHLARLRAELASTRTTLCPCGTKREHCNDHGRPETTDTEEPR